MSVTANLIVTSHLCNSNFSSHYHGKMCSKYLGIKLLIAISRLVSPAESLRDSSCVPVLSHERGGGMHDESLRESAGEAIWRWKEDIDNLSSGAHVVHTTAKQREWLLYLQR